MDFRILGPLEVLHNGSPVALNGPRQERIVAALLTAVDRTVGIAALIDTLWEDPPSTARTQVHNGVSILRRCLRTADPAVEIVSAAAGYRLEIADADMDACRFETLVEAGRDLARSGLPAEAAVRFRAALGLWRGPALGELATGRLAPQAVRLEEARAAAIEECVEAELAAGNGRQVIGELYALIEEFPLRERIHRHLMVALHGAGRRADALAVFRRARRILVDELGIEPGPLLQEAEQVVLTDTDAADQPKPAPVLCQLPPPLADFTGRGAELATIDQAARTGGVVAISGPGGMGKTSLAVQAAHRLRAAYPAGQLFADLRAGSPNPLHPAEVLHRLLNDLGVEPRAVPRDVAGMSATFRGLISSRRVLLVLDNAVDEAQLRPLLPGAGAAAVIVTSRRPLRTLDAAESIALGPLSPDEELRMMGRIVGDARVEAEHEAAHTLMGLCGRLPLAIRIAGVRLQARGHWSLARAATALGDEQQRLGRLSHGDLSVRTCLHMGYRQLPDDARDAFRRLGALGLAEVPLWLAAAACGRPVEETEELLAMLAEAHHVTVIRHTDDRYGFHDITRLFAEECAAELGPEEQRLTRARALDAARILAETAATNSPHGFFGGLGGPAARWSDPDLDPGPVLEDPLAWYAKELTTLAGLVTAAAGWGEAAHAWRIAAALVPFCEIRGHLAVWRRTHETALAAAVRLDDRSGIATMLYGLGELDTNVDEIDQAMDRLHRASSVFESLAEGYGRSICDSSIGHLLRVRGDYDTALTHLGSAVAVAARLGRPRAEAYARHAVAVVHLERGELARAAAFFGEALLLSRGSNYDRGIAQTLRGFARLRIAEGRFDEVPPLLWEAIGLDRRHGDRHNEASGLMLLAQAAIHRGENAEARALLHTSLGICEPLNDRFNQAFCHQLLAAAHDDDPAESARHRAAANSIWLALELPNWAETPLAPSRPPSP